MGESVYLPAHIDDLLMRAAMDRAGVVMFAGEERLSGRLDLPGEPAEIGFVLEQPGPHRTPSIGERVRLQYWSGGVRYRFLTDVIAWSSAGQARLRRPRFLDRSNRRLVPRVDLPVDPGTRFLLGDSADAPWFQVVDMSTGGLRLAGADGLPLTEVGQRVDGWLELPGHGLVPVRIEARHIGEQIGASFESIRPADRSIIARRLIEIEVAEAS